MNIIGVKKGDPPFSFKFNFDVIMSMKGKIGTCVYGRIIDFIIT